MDNNQNNTQNSDKNRHDTTKTTIGIVGGGQLARMMGEEIKRHNLPYQMIVLDPTERCPAYDYSIEQVQGRFDDPEKIKELAEKSDVMTFEIELADHNTLLQLKDQGKEIHPNPEALGIIRDKYIQAKFLEDNGLPVPETRLIENLDTLESRLSGSTFPLMIKKRMGSYDGRGNYLLTSANDVQNIGSVLGNNGLMTQNYIDFLTEISVIAARSTTGEIKTYEVGENIHQDNILRTTLFPAPNIPKKVQEEAQELAYKTLDALSGAGVFGIEMFVDKDYQLWINEIAPRVHNSGHHTIESCKTSQFYQHLLAITGQELGDTSRKSEMAVMENIIETGPMESFNMVGTKAKQYNGNTGIHMYGKHSLSSSPRKMGHLTVTSDQTYDSLEKLQQYAKEVRSKIKFEERNN